MTQGSSATTPITSMRSGEHGSEDRGVRKAALRPEQSRFGRMFDLQPCSDRAPRPEQLGLPKGPMHAKAGRNDSKTLPAVLTYFGQFVDHDITLDLTSSLERQADLDALVNFRTPTLELDCLYGVGPSGSPHLYDRRPERKDKLLVGLTVDGLMEADLPRNAQGVALLGDPRNDENLIVAQLHVAMLKFHNAIVDHLDAIDDGIADDVSRFAKAQRLTRWHYHWLILKHFLPAIVGHDTVDDILKNGRKLYDPPRIPFIPIEFSAAAYRYGHSMVQPGYTINDTFGAVLFLDDSAGPAPTTGLSRDLRGGAIRAEERVNWKNFVDTGVLMSPGAVTRFSSKIDRRLAGPLLRLPPSIVPPGVPASERSLAFRNLQRAVVLGLPSGQDVAVAVKDKVPSVKILDDAQIWEGTGFKDVPAPLWYYLLAEAEHQYEGERLGDVGSRIVAEVLIGLLQLDELSFLVRRPTWQPVVPDRAQKVDFDFVDLFRIAGTDVA